MWPLVVIYIKKEMHFPRWPADGTAPLVSKGRRKSGKAGLQERERERDLFVSFVFLVD